MMSESACENRQEPAETESRLRRGTPGRDISSRPVAVVETGVASAKRSEAHCSVMHYWIISRSRPCSMERRDMTDDEKRRHESQSSRRVFPLKSLHRGDRFRDLDPHMMNEGE